MCFWSIWNYIQYMCAYVRRKKQDDGNGEHLATSSFSFAIWSCPGPGSTDLPWDSIESWGGTTWRVVPLWLVSCWCSTCSRWWWWGAVSIGDGMSFWKCIARIVEIMGSETTQKYIKQIALGLTWYSCSANARLQHLILEHSHAASIISGNQRDALPSRGLLVVSVVSAHIAAY